MTYKNSFRTSQETHYDSSTKIEMLNMFREKSIFTATTIRNTETQSDSKLLSGFPCPVSVNPDSNSESLCVSVLRMQSLSMIKHEVHVEALDVKFLLLQKASAISVGTEQVNVETVCLAHLCAARPEDNKAFVALHSSSNIIPAFCNICSLFFVVTFKSLKCL
jgi:hypothetical protein